MSRETLSSILRRPLFWPLLILICGLLIEDDWSYAHHQPLVFPSSVQNYQGTLTQPPDYSSGKTKLTVRVDSEFQNLVQLTLLDQTQKFQQGDKIQFRTKLKTPVGFHNPGGFDYEKFLWRQGIVGTGFIEDSNTVTIIHHESESVIAKFIRHQKQILTETFTRLSTHHQTQAILQALLWGDRSQLNSDTKTIFRELGLAHLIVISGLHFAALAWILFWSIQSTLKKSPHILLKFSLRKITAGLTWLALTGYFLFCDSSPSLIRAYIGVSCYLLGLILNRTRDYLNLLFLAGIIILLLRPQDLFSLSFQLSFGAVLSLLLLTPKIESVFRLLFTRLKSKKLSPQELKGSAQIKIPWSQQLGEKTLQLISANLAIYLGVTPLIWLYFYQLQIHGLWLNLITVPLVEILIVPLSLLGLVTEFIFQPLSQIIFRLDLWLLENGLNFLTSLHHILHQPGLMYPPHQSELILYFLFLLSLFLPQTWPKKLKLILPSFFIFGLISLISYSIYQTHFNSTFRITHLDVGQGDAILVELPGAKRVLIDAGGSPYFPIGEKVILPFLLYKRIPQLDAICITHSDSDHYLGFKDLIKNIPIQELWWNGQLKESASFKQLIKQAQDKGIKLKKLQQGDQLNLGPQDRWKVLSPSAKTNSLKNNNQSLVLHLDVNQHTALFTGDIEFPIEYHLIQNFAQELQSEYLKVPHHGSHSSSRIEFIHQISPQIATVSSKRNNSFGHPHKNVLEIYEQEKISLYRTDLSGAIEIEFKRDEIKVRKTLEK